MLLLEDDNTRAAYDKKLAVIDNTTCSIEELLETALATEVKSVHDCTVDELQKVLLARQVLRSSTVFPSSSSGGGNSNIIAEERGATDSRGGGSFGGCRRDDCDDFEQQMVMRYSEKELYNELCTIFEPFFEYSYYSRRTIKFPQRTVLCIVRNYPMLLRKSYGKSSNIMSYFLRARADLVTIQELIQICRDSGIDITIENGFSPLHDVAVYGAEEGVLEYLVERFPEMLSQSNKGREVEELPLELFLVKLGDDEHASSRDLQRTLDVIDLLFPTTMAGRTRIATQVLSDSLTGGYGLEVMQFFFEKFSGIPHFSLPNFADFAGVGRCQQQVAAASKIFGTCSY